MPRQRGDGDRVGAVGVDQAGDLDDGVGVEHRQGAAVAHVQDQRRALVPGDRPHQRQRHLLVAPGQVLGLTLPRAGALPVLGHVGRLPLGAGAVPHVQRRAVGAQGLRVETGLLVAQEGTPGLLGLLVGAYGVPVEVVVVQVLVGDRAERLQPVGAEQPSLLEGAEQRGVGEQAREFVASGDVQAAHPAEVVEADVVDVGLLRVGAEDAGDTAAEADG